MKLIEKVKSALEQNLEPITLEIHDESANHTAGNSETRAIFHLEIVSPAFNGKKLIEQHRMIYDCLGAELESGIHALAIKSKGTE